jgi:HAE1 family hydrophobic/amphiphilic exporter-1
MGGWSHGGKSLKCAPMGATPFSVKEPQVWLDLDRERCKILGVPIADTFQALQSYLGGFYINDFNLYGRTFRVVMQAEARFRQTPEDLQRFYVRSTSGKMIPLSDVVTLSGTNGPLVLNHFNLLRSADIFGVPASGYSSGQALQAMEEVATTVLPPGYLRLDDHGLSREESGARGPGLCVRHRASVSVTGGAV